MFMPQGVLLTTLKTSRATPPSCIRGASACPRPARTRRSRPQSRGSACRSATKSRRWTSLARPLAEYGPRWRVRFMTRSTREGAIRKKKASAPRRTRPEAVRTRWRRGEMGSAPELEHRAVLRGDALVEAVAGGLQPHRPGQDGLHLALVSPPAQRPLQVELVVVEEAEVELPVCSEPHAVARPAVGLAHRADEAHDALAVVETE